jgi:hypothetical protein
MEGEIKLFFHPIINAKVIVDQCDSANMCHLLMQMKMPPVEMIQAIGKRLEGIERIGIVPAALPPSYYRSVNIKGNISCCLVNTNNDPVVTSETSARFLTAALVVMNNYCDKVVNSISNILVYEACHQQQHAPIEMFGDNSRLNKYKNQERRDLDNLQEELTNVCNTIAWWWDQNPKALYLIPTTGVLMFIDLVQKTKGVTSKVLNVLASLSSSQMQIHSNELSNSAIATFCKVYLNNNVPVVFMVGAETVLTIILKLLVISSKVNELTRSFMSHTVYLILKSNLYINNTICIDSYLTEQAALKIISWTSATEKDIKLAILMLVHHSAQHPKRRVLNLTHATLTNALNTTKGNYTNELRRLITASATNRRDFMSYDCCISDADRNVWWACIGPMKTPSREYVIPRFKDALIEHPIVSESCVHLNKQPLRMESILKLMNKNEMKDPFTNTMYKWSKLIANDGDIIRMETFY